MSDEAEPGEENEGEPEKKGGKGMIIGIALAAVLGGGGFFASYNGMVPGLGGGGGEEAVEEPTEIMVATTIAEFVPIDRMVISLGSANTAKHLNFGAALEVAPEFKEEVTLLKPRILDVLNTYLRAVEVRDIENPAAMTRLRAQMLRRVNIVTGEGRVNDLLITEFVLN